MIPQVHSTGMQRHWVLDRSLAVAQAERERWQAYSDVRYMQNNLQSSSNVYGSL